MKSAASRNDLIALIGIVAVFGSGATSYSLNDPLAVTAAQLTHLSMMPRATV